jgi:hypothetical protein
MSFTGSGTLIVKPLNAKLTRDTDFLSKMDPYCNIRLGTTKYRTRTHESGGLLLNKILIGKHPHWNDTLTFRRINETSL